MPFSARFTPFKVDGPGRHASELLVRTAVSVDADAWERDWQPALRSAGVPTSDWPWRAQIESALVEDGRHCLVVERGARREALMSLTLDRSRLITEPSRAIVYVEYIAVAPENLPPPIGTKAIRGLGALLMREAMRFSLQLGLEGRVGLHSKPESEGFYRGLGMRDVLREETADGTWLYFESEPSAALRLLEEENALR